MLATSTFGMLEVADLDDVLSVRPVYGAVGAISQ